MKAVLDWIIVRGKERSTILTVLTLIGGAVGFNFAPEQQEAIIGIIVAVLTAICVFTKEAKPNV